MESTRITKKSIRESLNECSFRKKGCRANSFTDEALVSIVLNDALFFKSGRCIFLTSTANNYYCTINLTHKPKSIEKHIQI